MAAAAHPIASASAQLQQVPAIKIISDTSGSCDLKKLVKENDDLAYTANEAPVSPASMTKCKSLLNMKNLPKLALTQDVDDAAKCHQMMVFDDPSTRTTDLGAKESLVGKMADVNHHLSAYDAPKLPCKQHNFFVGSNNNLFFSQHAPPPLGNMPRRLNRKCLSRINLNLYQQQPLILQPPHNNNSNNDPSKKMFKKNADSASNKTKSKTLNHSLTSNEIDLSCSLKTSTTSNLEAFNRMTKPYSSSSIMNLEKVTDAAHLVNGTGAVAVPSSTSSNQILSPPPHHVNDFAPLSHHGQFRKGSNMYINFSGNDGGGGAALSAGGYGLGYLRSSNMNLYKSSTSLNALDLELLDSVSVGSFDRESIYSNYANSECELSNYCLYDPVQFYVHPASQNQFQAAKMPPLENEGRSEAAAGLSARDSKLSNSMASLRINSSSSTKTNSKVISWLQNI